MPGHAALIKLISSLLLTSVTLSASSAFAQSQATRPDSRQKEVAEPNGRPVNEAAAEKPPATSLESEVEALKAENGVVRDLLRKMEEQQQSLLEQVDRLQRRLDGVTTAVAQPSGQPQIAEAGEHLANGTGAPVAATSAANTSVQQPPAEKQDNDHYQDGVIIWKNPEGAKVPFLLKFNNNTQIRYLNTLDSRETFTDHQGVVRDVHNRNDITVNRSMFILAGYMFDPKLQYSLTVWTSAGAASIVVAGNIGWRFNKALTLTGGYTGVPGSRSSKT